MTHEEHHTLVEIATGRNGWEARLKLRKYLETVTVREYPEPPAESTTAPNTRTLTQNRALHLGFQLIADALNGAGLDMRAVLKPEIEMPWDKDTVKEYLFKPVMKLMRLKDSTTELAKSGDIDRVWETVMRFLMQNHHIEYIDFPSDATKNNIRLQAMENLQRDEEHYPKHTKTAFDS